MPGDLFCITSRSVGAGNDGIYVTHCNIIITKDGGSGSAFFYFLLFVCLQVQVAPMAH